MDFLEKDLEDIIYETNNQDLRDRGLMINGVKRRQLKIGNYGRLDLVTAMRFYQADTIIITIYEFKRGEIDFSTFQQALRYANGIKDYFDSTSVRFYYQFQIVLVGRNFGSDDVTYLPTIFDNVSLYTYSYEFDGIKFHRLSKSKLINNGF